MIASLYLSFTDYSLLSEAHWVGLKNYDTMFTADDRFTNSLKVTTTYVVVSVPLQLAFALGLAMALDRGLRGLSFYRSVFYLPSLLGGSVAISILWRKIFGTDGIVNTFLGWFGYHGQGWVTSPDTALWTLIVLHVWTFGAPMVIFLAGLRQIPRSLYEAARVDGAGRLRQFPVVHAVVRRQRRQRRAGRLDPLLHALPLHQGLQELRDGLRGRHGVGAPPHHRGPDRRQLPHVSILGLLWRRQVSARRCCSGPSPG
ncbi:hypothetical protein GCM10023178_24820 [Actinomadura luteofluorescens]